MFILCTITMLFDYSDQFKPDCHNTHAKKGQMFQKYNGSILSVVHKIMDNILNCHVNSEYLQLKNIFVSSEFQDLRLACFSSKQSNFQGKCVPFEIRFCMHIDIVLVV